MSAFIASVRFGLGPRPGELRDIGGDPRGWLREQLHGADAASGRTTRECMQVLWPLFKDEDRTDFKKQSRAFLESEAQAATEQARRTRAPFRERMARFFSNHLAVSITRREIAGVVGAYEREAIRPNLGGSFADMLVAATRHPAMLLYLDNVRSVGPNSRAGLRHGKDINENLGREVLELHTLGVDGGYTQADVQALATALTGWTVDEDGFVFLDRMHEGAPQTVMGTTYHAAGVEQAEQILRDLAVHPSTARHLATKLARHLVADDPPPEAVRTLEDAWLRSDGDLPTVLAAAIELDAAWSAPLTKLRTPQELVLATARALRWTDDEAIVRSYGLLGQGPWAAPSPQGYPDVAAEWAGPDAVVARVDWARRVAAKAGEVDLAVVMADVAGPFAPKLLRRERNDPEGLALLLASPTFQRR